MTPTLNVEQSDALLAIDYFLNGVDSFFVLSGSAGTGKTFCVRELVNRTKGRFIFTAPTNKATKVLRESVTRDDYKPECRTIYSLLKLRLEANGEVKELKAPEDPIDISAYKAVIVDEASMVNANLFEHIKLAAERFKIKFIFLGDAAQLPPVKELRSPVWDLPFGSKLLTVMRHDNAILALATALREQVDKFAPRIKLAASNDGEQGIWQYPGIQFEKQILLDVDAGAFVQPNGSKVIAWRNVEVDKFNEMIRARIFPQASAPWLVGDRVLFTAPAKDIDDEPMASTDDEGEVTRVDTEWHAVHGEFKIFRIAITLDNNQTVVARVLHPESRAAFVKKTEAMLAEARSNSRKWKDFWDFKDAFHSLRYAYAITAHRAQGSTYDTAFVYWQDILSNQNRQEAFRCLYVACTRPKRCLVLS
jgi:exodeoxyribonuclease-5